MHEAAIAANVIEIASAASAGRGIIRAIGLRLGAFTGVVRESLEFAFDALKAGTPARLARLEICMVQLTAECPGCGWQGTPAEGFCLICSRCKGPLRILSGRELQVEYVEIDEEGAPTNGTNHDREQGSPQERRVCGSEPAGL